MKLNFSQWLACSCCGLNTTSSKVRRSCWEGPGEDDKFDKSGSNIKLLFVIVSYPGPWVEGPVVLRLEVEVDHHDHGGQDVDGGEAHLRQAEPDQPVSAQDGGGGGAGPALKAAEGRSHLISLGKSLDNGPFQEMKLKLTWVCGREYESGGERIV